MESSNATFAFLIATKNRCQELLYSLNSLAPYLANPAVRCVVFDDGSTDGTSQAIQDHFPAVELWRNDHSKGYLYCRNQLLNQVDADYLISLDDDAHFLSDQVLELIQQNFENQPKVGVLAFRIFWSTQLPKSMVSSDVPQAVNSYVGCGHVWRKTAWQLIPNYPEWFQFYGEEYWATLQLYQQGFTVQYVPQILVHHRADQSKRAENKEEFNFRYRYSLRAGWYTFFLLYPLRQAIYFWIYSLAKQLQKLIWKRQLKIVKPLFGALLDLFRQLPLIIQNRNPLQAPLFKQFQQLNEAKIYWNPEK